MDVQTLVIEGKLSAGHARALITAENPSELAKQVVKDGLSVRATEALVKKQQQGDVDRPAPKSRNINAGKDADTRALEKDLAAILAMKVAINHKPGTETGQVVLTYENLDQLDDLCAKLSR
jgi:ParB family chromosome partitioning protein